MKKVCQTNSLGGRCVCGGGGGCRRHSRRREQQVGGQHRGVSRKGELRGVLQCKGSSRQEADSTSCAEDAFALCSGKVCLNRRAVIPSRMTESV